nr:serine/threonine-protein kinase PEPKR2-like [Tanacetum cinerariifolium]
MDHLGRKRKGVDMLASSGKKQSSFEVIRSHVSLGDYSRKTKKCKEVVVPQRANDQNRFITGIVTAPPFVSVGSDPRGRGHKRKIGCIDSATRMGRKKKIEQEFERDAPYFHLVMELCSGGRLLDQMRKDGVFSEQKAANLIKELMLVLKFCHEMGVIHRDVKPENILLSSSGSIKLADFGLAARVSNGQTLYGVVGSPAYVALEILTGGYSKNFDIWSAGGLWDSISQPAHDLIAHMLTRNVSERNVTLKVVNKQWLEQ